MHEIICPHCGTAFKIDEARYADILKQVRDKDFEKQLHERLELAAQDKRNAVELAQAKLASELQKEASAKDAELKELKARLDSGETARKLAVAEALSPVEKERNELTNELAQAKRDQQSAAKLAEATLVNEVQKVSASKEAEIQALQAKLEASDVAQQLAVTKAVGVVEKERNELKSGLERAKLEKDLAEKSLKEKYETQIKDREDTIERLKDMPLSLRLVCELHARLMAGVRGQHATPGEFRRSQNWIGGTRPGNAAFVPPPPQQVTDLLTDLDRFIHATDPDLPPLVRVALIHAQFETIHPFLDGNGRIGRLLIAALMEHWGLLAEPLMYLSGYLKQHQAEYYRRLSAIRSDGDWEGWVSFFLEGVTAASADAERSIIDVASLIAADRKRLLASPKSGPISYRLFELLPMMPRFSVEHVRQRLETTFPTASAAVKLLEDLGILAELTGQKKNRVYSYQAYVELLSR